MPLITSRRNSPSFPDVFAFGEVTLTCISVPGGLSASEAVKTVSDGSAMPLCRLVFRQAGD